MANTLEELKAERSRLDDKIAAIEKGKAFVHRTGTYPADDPEVNLMTHYVTCGTRQEAIAYFKNEGDALYFRWWLNGRN